MPTPPLSDEKAREAVDAYLKSDRNKVKAAQLIGISDKTLNHRLKIADRRGFLGSPQPTTEIQLPEFPDDDLPTEALLDHLEKRFVKRQESFDAHTWFPVKVKDNKPIGVLWFGDPHIDDNGCNLPVLRKHAGLCQATPGLYGANIGDTTNNWSGRLIHLYAEQDTSKSTARRLAKWFMLESGIRWIVYLIGNHDAWGDGAEILASMGKQFGTQKVVCHDWEARFCLAFPNGWEPRIYAAHDFPGHSQWNPLHGPMKEGQMGQAADLYVCGHKHNWACFTFENAARGDEQTFIRVRGYKFQDDYARRIGKLEQQRGCAILTIFDPSDRSITYFENVDKGADYLTKLRV